MAKSKSKAKKSSGNTSNAKNIKALINQNKMIENQNAEAEKRKQEEAEAREKAKQEKLAAEQAKAVEADEIIEPDAMASATNVADTNLADTKGDKESKENAKDANAPADKKKEKEEGYVFTPVKELKITPIKKQNRSGTCWSFSEVAF